MGFFAGRGAVVTVLLCAAAWALVILVNPLVAAALLIAAAAVFAAVKTDVFFFAVLFVLLYPALPFQAGISFGEAFPVIRAHRVLMFFFILCWMSKKKTQANAQSLAGFPMTLSLAAVLLVYAASFFVNGNVGGMFFFTGEFVFENFMIAFIFYDVFRSRKEGDFQRLFFFMMAAAIVPFFLGVFEYATGANAFAFIEPYRNTLSGFLQEQERFGVVRVRGGFSHSIIYGLFFAMTMPAAFVYFMHRSRVQRRKRNILYLLGFLAFSFAGVYMSASRVALAVFFVNAVLMAVYVRVASPVVFTVALVTLAAAPFTDMPFLKKAVMLVTSLAGGSTDFSELGYSSYSRMKQFFYYWKDVIRSPLLGQGQINRLGQQRVIDNRYLYCLINNGLAGMAVYVWFFLQPMIMAARGAMYSGSSESRYRDVSFCAFTVTLSTLIAFGVLTLTDHLYLVWIYIGLFLAARYKHGRQKEQTV